MLWAASLAQRAVQLSGDPAWFAGLAGTPQRQISPVPALPLSCPCLPLSSVPLAAFEPVPCSDCMSAEIQHLQMRFTIRFWLTSPSLRFHSLHTTEESRCASAPSVPCKACKASFTAQQSFIASHTLIQRPSLACLRSRSLHFFLCFHPFHLFILLFDGLRALIALTLQVKACLHAFLACFAGWGAKEAGKPLLGLFQLPWSCASCNSCASKQNPRGKQDGQATAGAAAGQR